MKKDPGVFLGHILDSIELIESYSRGETKLDLMESVGLQDQIIRRIEIIGEAVKNLPDDLRARHGRNEGHHSPSVFCQKVQASWAHSAHTRAHGRGQGACVRAMDDGRPRV